MGWEENIEEKGGLPAFSPFPAMFSKVFFYRVVKSQDSVIKVSQVKTARNCQQFKSCETKFGIRHFSKPLSLSVQF